MDSSSNLYCCLSGLLSGLSGVHRNFKIYDEDLADLYAAVGEIDVSPSESRMGYSRRYIEDLTGASTYTLEDGIYRTAVSQNTTFVLSDPEDDTIFHEILITVKFNNVYNVIFKDGNGNTLETQGTNAFDQNDVVEYLCRYESFLSKWCIIPMKVGAVS